APAEGVPLAKQSAAPVTELVLSVGAADGRLRRGGHRRIRWLGRRWHAIRRRLGSEVHGVPLAYGRSANRTTQAVAGERKSSLPRFVLRPHGPQEAFDALPGCVVAVAAQGREGEVGAERLSDPLHGERPGFPATATPIGGVLHVDLDGVQVVHAEDEAAELLHFARVSLDQFEVVGWGYGR